MKKCIVIGATSGIGRELSRLYVSKGYMTGITGRRENLLRELGSENPASYKIKSFDISKPDTNFRNLEELSSELGGLDLIIINSGTGNGNDELKFEIEKDTVLTNVLGSTEIAGWAFNYFRKQGYGQIAIVTSIAGMRGGRFAPAYSASKAYLINYAEGLRQKAKKLKLNVSVTDIRPGFVDTAMAKSDNKFWVATPKKAAEQIYSALIRKKKIAYITRRWIIIAYILKLLPKWIFDKI
ncbi:MAG: SDR family NAD(P)-dependent oxidoreductase [Ignavibacteriae bacterium]|nr:SDR family NAD(P)-dependent oxidoreductase [Ignavibacteriota bacterium]